MGSGVLRGLQILLSGGSAVRGGFDSHTFPPSRPAIAALPLLLLVFAAAGRAEEPSPAAAAPDSVAWVPAVAPAPPDTTTRRVRPFFVMARSAIVPGWGQVYNRQPLKAVAVVAGEGFLIYKIFQELDLENQAIDRQVAAIPDSPEYDTAVADELTHYNRKVNWIWWTAAAHLLQMADAYVDAHFLNFDAEFGPAEARSDSRGARRVTLSLRIRF
jgi:hypothetical protein